MAGSFSDYLENKILDHVTGKTAYTSPTAYLALFTAAPNDAGGGTEANYTSYARKQTAGSDWNAASGGSVSNAGTLSFPACTGGTNTATHAALFDASTNGNMLAWGSLAASLSISTGITPSFLASQITMTLD